MKRRSILNSIKKRGFFLPIGGYLFRIAFLVIPLLFNLDNSVFGQTAGMVIKPALSPGNTVLDPDGDGYVSQKTNGVQLGFTNPPNNDVSQSEIPYVDMQKIDPVADLLRGPNGGFSEIIGVDAAGNNAILWYSDGTNLLYRFRIDNFAPNSKSYSVLLDTDSKFGFTGIGADPNALTGNPGFEVEIVLETNFNVKVYNVDGLTAGVLVASYSYETNCQKSIARTVTSGDADYFYDFFVAYPTTLFTSSTPLRSLTLTSMNPHPAIGNNAQSDVGGGGGTGSLDQTFINIIGTETPTLPGTPVLDRSACPVINAVGTTSTTISGTSTEASGTNITVKVYQSDGVTLLGSATTTTSGTAWTINVSALSPSVTLASGQLVKATATAVGKGISADNCSIKTVTGCAGITSTTGVVLTKISGGKGYTVANTFPAGTIITWYNADYTVAVYPTKSGSLTNIVNPQTTTAASQTITFSTATGQTFPNDVFYFTFQVPGQCVSNYLSDCQFSPIGSSVAPVITTTTITPSTTSVSGTCASTTDTHISLFANGILLQSITVVSSTTWTISGLNLTSYDCATITATAADLGKCPTASAGVAVSHAGLKPSINTSGCSPTSPVTSITGFSNDADGTVITLYDTNPTRSAIGTGTVAGGAWTITPSPSLVSGDIIVAAATSGGCISVGPDSDPVTIATQSSLSAYTINITAPTEGESVVSGTISGGSYPVTLKVYVDQTLVGSGVTVSAAGPWSVGSLLSTDLYIGAAINVTLTAASSCESVLSAASATVQCLQPAAPAYLGGSFHYCLGGAGQLTVTGTQSLVIYQLVDGSGNAQGPATVGTGGSITLRTNVLNTNLGPVYVKAFKLANPTCYVTGSTEINFNQVDLTPTVTFSNTSVSVLRGTTTVNLPYSAKSSTPAADTYTIEYSILAKNQGFLNVTSPTTIPSSSIVLTVPSNPALGSYSGTLTVANSSGATCTSSYGFTITVYAADSPPVISAQPSTATICSGGTTVLSVTAVNATGYQWQSCATYGGTFTNVSGGSGANTASYTTVALTSKTFYRVVVSNANPGANGTVISAIVPVFVTAQPSAAGAITGSASVCQGTSGSYSIAAISGATSYTWSSGGSNVSITGGTTTVASLSFASNATSGTLSVTANNSCGSSTAATTGITVGETPAINNKAITTCNGAEFTVLITDLTGTVPSGTTFTWPAPVLSGVITGSAASVGTPLIISGALTNTTGSIQTATYTITPVYGSCTGATFSLTVSVNPTINLVATPVDAACYGAFTGSITLAVTGGSPGYSYAWSATGGFTATTQNLSALAAKVYTVVVTDSKNCTATTPATVGQPAADISITPTPTGVSCNGGNDGQIALAVTGGTGSYTYLWNDGSAAVPPRTTFAAGTYSVTVTDVNGCTKQATGISVTQQGALNASVGKTNTTCNGLTNGTITVSSPSGGYGTYQCRLDAGGWQTVTVSNPYTFTGLAATTYSVQIRDAAHTSCVVTLGNQIITAPSAVTVGGVITHVNCYDVATGTINITAGGGTVAGLYAYDWGGSITTEDRTALSAGSYGVTVTDDNGCTATGNYTVTQPSAVLSASASSVAMVTCNGGTNGAISLTVTGGTAPYTYSWTASPGAIPTGQSGNKNLTGLVAGTYNVTVTDNKGCNFSPAAITVTPPDAISLPTSITNVSCNGLSDGAVNLTPSGGTPGYSYVWSTTATTEDISSLPIGTYSVTVTDANGCKANTSATVTQSAVLNGTISATPVTCHNLSTGKITVSSPTGGYGTFECSINGTNWYEVVTSYDFTGLAAGTYSVQIRDKAHPSCSATLGSLIVVNPAVITVSNVEQTRIACNGGNATVTITASGGTGALSYTFDGVTNSTGIFTHAAGASLAYNVTDANNCTAATGNFTIIQPGILTASTSSVTNVLCNGASTGRINLTVSGGNAPYSYVWTASNGGSVPSGQSGNRDLTGLIAGDYSVAITDSKLCTYTLSGVSVTQPTAMSLPKSITDVVCNGQSNGAIDLSPSGGTPGLGFTYVWSNGSTNQDLSALPIGTYSVTVTDANGCKATTSATVGQPATLSGSIAVTNATCNGSFTGSSLVLTVSGGNALGGTPYSWSPGGETTKDLSNIAVGAYTVTITDSKGCTATAGATVAQPAAFSMTTTYVRPTCPPSTDGSINLTVTGGTSGYTYDWVGSGGGVIANDQHTLSNPAGLNPGTYTVTVRDNKGCETSTSVTLTYLHPAAAVPGTITKN